MLRIYRQAYPRSKNNMSQTSSISMSVHSWAGSRARNGNCFGPRKTFPIAESNIHHNQPAIAQFLMILLSTATTYKPTTLNW